MRRKHANSGLLLGDRIEELLKSHKIAQFKAISKNCTVLVIGLFSQNIVFMKAIFCNNFGKEPVKKTI